MARLYTNENLEIEVARALRAYGHDVATTRDAGRDNKREPDEMVLAFAAEQGRIVVTHNRWDYIKLHRKVPHHAGIIICTMNLDFHQLAACIHANLQGHVGDWSGCLERVERPHK